MNEIQSINLVDFTPEGKAEIRGRQLHMKLDIGTEYAKWMSRMIEYGFVEGVDFNSVKNDEVRQEGNRNVKREVTDHILTLNMAKEIAMLQRTPEGQEIRRYLIKVEEEWNSPEKVMARAVLMANNKVKELTAVNVKLEHEVVGLNATINELKPKADYVDRILKSTSLVTTTQIAKDYGMGAPTFNDKLNKLKVQHKVGGQWVLYAKYQGKGYASSETIEVAKKDGSTKTVMHTKWTQKGRLFLHDLLKKHNILPMIEQVQ